MTIASPSSQCKWPSNALPGTRTQNQSSQFAGITHLVDDLMPSSGRYKETQETDTQGEEGHVITETETGMSHLQAKELQGLMQPAKARGGREEFFPEPSEGACPCGH
ncbi:unnamed protein product [Rangifer tarandus platyrhynchus]|uniref:Uncharacterized protein n=1 Tax=Rangifer tarandus platyrhynchus TaxID=3082113 RepID=A0AC59YJG8_RANTA